MTRNFIRFNAAAGAAHDLPEASSRLGWRILLTLLLLMLVILLSLLLQPARTASASSPFSPLRQSTGDPLVLAFYYTWFDENTWSYDQLSDLPVETYVSRDRNAMGRHIDQAKAAGIDGFLVAWYGPYGDSNQTEANLSALLDEAAARNFKIGVLFETDSPFMGGVDSTVTGLQHLLGTHASHPAFLRADARPVIFFWKPSIFGIGTWQAIRDQTDPGYGSLWIAEGVDTSLLAVFDGHYLYSNTWNPPADLAATNRKFADQVNAMRQSTGAGKLWIATVMPGYDDVRVRPAVGFVQDRQDGAYYERAWQAAISSNPNWVVITSFNEWPEGTHIEPSIASGDRYLGLTARWSSMFKSGSAAPVAAPPDVEAVSAEIPEPDRATAFVSTPVLNLRAGPGIDYALKGLVEEGVALTIGGQNVDADWWQVETKNGPAWVFGELVTAMGPLDTVPIVAPVSRTRPDCRAGSHG